MIYDNTQWKKKKKIDKKKHNEKLKKICKKIINKTKHNYEGTKQKMFGNVLKTEKRGK